MYCWIGIFKTFLTYITRPQFPKILVFKHTNTNMQCFTYCISGWSKESAAVLFGIVFY